MTHIQAFRLKNSYLIGLATWLGEISLSGKESRERTRFLRQLVEAYQQMEKDRKEILAQASLKDENGKPKMLPAVDNIPERYDVPEEKLEDVNKEIVALYDEEFVIDITPSNEANIKCLANIVLNTDYKFGPRDGDNAIEAQAKIRQANDYDRWCEAFENVKFTN